MFDFYRQVRSNNEWRLSLSECGGLSQSTDFILLDASDVLRRSALFDAPVARIPPGGTARGANPCAAIRIVHSLHKKSRLNSSLRCQSGVSPSASFRESRKDSTTDGTQKMLSELSYNRDRSAGCIVAFETSVGSGQSGL